MVQDNAKKQLTKQERQAAEKKQEIRQNIILGLVLLLCVAGVFAVFAVATPEKALTCDGGSTSLLQFGTCR